jgi:hypothetical protein
MGGNGKDTEGISLAYCMAHPGTHPVDRGRGEPSDEVHNVP